MFLKFAIEQLEKDISTNAQMAVLTVRNSVFLFLNYWEFLVLLGNAISRPPMLIDLIHDVKNEQSV